MLLTKVKLEYLGEDKEVPGAQIWKVEAIHVTTTGNKRKFTLKELEESARSLAFRPLNINHDETRRLPFFSESAEFLENSTLEMHFAKERMSVFGRIRVSDEETNRKINSGDIEAVSIEQIPTKGESCNEIYCEQHGVAFIGLALLEKGVTPGDSRARIIKNETLQKNFATLEDCLVSDAQRECKDCTDDTACHECKHKIEANDECLHKAIRAAKEKHQDLGRDEILAIAINECELANSKEESWAYYNRMLPFTESLFKN